jgi:hypothetical protein
MDMVGIVVNTMMACTISTEGHTFCIVHFISKLNLCCKVPLTKNSWNRRTADSANSCYTCRFENCWNNLTDVVLWIASLNKQTNNIAVSSVKTPLCLSWWTDHWFRIFSLIATIAHSFCSLECITALCSLEAFHVKSWDLKMM